MSKLFLLFALYSFFGWILEVIFKFVQFKKFVNRGFLIGPFCPIYGFGFLILFFLSKISNNIFAIFFLSMLFCAFLEYFVSWILEFLFRARWWDYSHKKFNINGRICIRNLIFFGLLGCVGVFYLNTFFFSIVKSINKNIINFLSISIFLILIVDVIVSVSMINNLKDCFNNIRKDATEEISKKVRNILISKSIYFRRVIAAYPNFHFSSRSIKFVKERISKYSRFLKKKRFEN